MDLESQSIFSSLKMQEKLWNSMLSSSYHLFRQRSSISTFRSPVVFHQSHEWHFNEGIPVEELVNNNNKCISIYRDFKTLQNPNEIRESRKKNKNSLRNPPRACPVSHLFEVVSYKMPTRCMRIRTIQSLPLV